MYENATATVNNQGPEPARLLKNRSCIDTSTRCKKQLSATESNAGLPNINVCINTSYCNNVSKLENCTAINSENGALKLPHLNNPTKELVNKQNFRGALSNQNNGNDKKVKFEEKDMNTNNLLKGPSKIFKKRSLEESLKDSLKLCDNPSKCYIPGENKSTRHLMLEMNEFYFDMAEELRFLKDNLLDSARKKLVDPDDTSLSSYGSEFQKLVEFIEQNEEKVAENVKLLQEIKEERDVIHEEIKSLDGKSSTNVKASEKNIEIQNVINPLEFAEIVKLNTNERPPDNNNDNKKKNVQHEKDFIAKNKELAKEYNMSRHSLTDDEKKKLQSLLADIDECEGTNTDDCKEEVKEHENEYEKMMQSEILAEENSENDNKMQPNSFPINGFKFQPDEDEILNDLQSKLTNLKAEETKIQEENDNNDGINELERDESKGKHWKFHLLQTRLRTIEKDLAAIQIEKNKENEENNEDDDEESRIDIEKEYNKSINEISVDIGELEYEEMKESQKSINEISVGIGELEYEEMKESQKQNNDA